MSIIAGGGDLPLASGDTQNNDNMKPINMKNLKKSKGIEKAISDRFMKKFLSEVRVELE